jgi:uncharacterized protein
MSAMSNEESSGSKSRFAYHGEESEEGGVTSVREKPARGTTSGAAPPRGFPASNGAPGPEERLLDISELARTVGMRYVHKFRIPAGVIPDFDAVTPTEGEITLTNAGDVLVLRGDAAATIRMECVRCLEPTDQFVETEIDEAFPLVTTNNAYHQEEVHAVDEDLPAAVITGNILDLGDLLRQSLTVAAPPQPVCREDCPGILGRENVPFVSEEPAPTTTNPFQKLAALLDPADQPEETDEDSQEK